MNLVRETIYKNTLSSEANVLLMMHGSFHWSTLHLAFYCFGKFDRVRLRNLRADVSRAQRGSLSVRRRAEARVQEICASNNIIE